MAANFEYNGDGIAMFATRERNRRKVWWEGCSWFSEDLILGDDATTEDLFAASGLADHFVGTSPLIADHSGEIKRLIGLGASCQEMDARKLRAIVKKLQQSIETVESHKLIRRENDGKQLAVMGKDYTPVQIREAFSVLDQLVEDGEIVLETVGSLADGRKTFMSAKLTGDDVEIVPGDVMERYIICRDSYDGSTTLDYGAASTLIVCQNTERVAFGEAKRSGRFSKQKHTKGIMSETRLAQAREALGIVQRQLKLQQEFGQALASIKMSDSEVSDFHKALTFFGSDVPADLNDAPKHRRTQLAELDYLYRHGMGADIEGRKGTAWGAYNSVTEWTNHMKRHKRSTSVDRTNFVLYGSGDTVNQRAKQLLTAQYQMAA
jgi:phage/plasmid-like protein (TIGR03299 family)